MSRWKVAGVLAALALGTLPAAAQTRSLPIERAGIVALRIPDNLLGEDAGFVAPGQVKRSSYGESLAVRGSWPAAAARPATSIRHGARQSASPSVTQPDGKPRSWWSRNWRTVVPLALIGGGVAGAIVATRGADVPVAGPPGG